MFRSAKRPKAISAPLASMGSTRAFVLGASCSTGLSRAFAFAREHGALDLEACSDRLYASTRVPHVETRSSLVETARRHARQRRHSRAGRDDHRVDGTTRLLDVETRDRTGLTNRAEARTVKTRTQHARGFRCLHVRSASKRTTGRCRLRDPARPGSAGHQATPSRSGTPR